MAKGSQFWGQASGKLGEQVLYRAGGEQRARSYTKNVKNPKTLAQMKNRIAMANLVAVFNQLKPILKESFPNRPTNQSGFNAFVSANKNKQTPVLDSGMIALGYSVPYNMNISKGAIQLPEFKARAGFNFGDSFSSIVPVAETIDGQTSQESAISYVMSALGLPSDAKITIVVATDYDEGFDVVHSTGLFSEFRAVARAAGLANPTVELNSDDRPNEVELSLGTGLDDKLIGVIVSYTDVSGKLQVNTARIVKGSTDGPDVTTFLPGGEVYEAVLNNYGYTEDSLLSTK